MVDWRRTGVFGHGQGGTYVPFAANLMQRSKILIKNKVNVAAMVVSHADAEPDVPLPLPKPAIPAMFTTGTDDQGDKDRHVYHFFQEYPALDKVYANLDGAGHLEPWIGHLNNFSAA